MEEHVTRARALELLFGAWTPEISTETIPVEELSGLTRDVNTMAEQLGDLMEQNR